MNMRPHKATKLKRRKEPTAPRRRSSSVANLPGQLDSRTRELAEAREQQAATGEILRVISSSPTDVRPVFDTIVRSAVRLCDGVIGAVNTFDGELTHCVAVHNYTPEALAAVQRMYPMRPSRQQLSGRAILSRAIVHVPDVLSDPEYAPDIALAGGWRGGLAVPMTRNEVAIGVILVMRAQAGPFSQEQIELVKNFAHQAVIAIENTRLLNELRESLQQQTATADVLKVISRSTFDLQVVLNTLTESVARLCEADMAAITRQKGTVHYWATSYGLPPELSEYLKSIPLELGRGSVVGRTQLEGKTVHVRDVLADPEYTALEFQRRAGFRTVLGVPLLREGSPIGVIVLLRSEVQPFTDKQIALLQTFADQAVIAIENVRLFDAEQQRTRELSEALEQQTATSEVLKVISSSPGELEPVFKAMLANAVRICEASYGVLFRFENGAARAAVMLGVPTAFAEFWQREPRRPGPRTALGRVVEPRQTVHIVDVPTEPAYVEGEPVYVAAANLGGFRTFLNVPMLKDNELIGVFAIYRQEVRPFTDKQIELVKSFAAQAVIAIENTRLLNEPKEALERQTATSEILSVISSSPSDTQPVFDAIVRSGLKLFPDAAIMIALADGEQVKAAAVADSDPARAEVLRRRFPIPLTRDYMNGVAILDARVVDIPDATKAPPGIAAGIRNFLTSGYRAATNMPMLRGNAAIGVLSVNRLAPGPLTEKQIALLRTFANQAVIAIENTRLLNELRESLQQQTATADVLKVISRSTFDLQT